MSLPYDIIFEIFLRLRVKTLSRFQCVSKPWKAIISNPDFRKSHLRRAERNPLILAVTNIDNDDPYSKKIQLQTWDKRGTLSNKLVETRFSSSPYWQVKTCLELVCIHNMKDTAVFWNLSTEESIVLPLNLPAGCVLETLGFGYVPSTREYKVLLVISSSMYSPTSGISYQVFTLCGDGQKRYIASPPLLVHAIHLGDAIFVNGAIHFLTSYHQAVLVDIAAFDLGREEWSMIPSAPLLLDRSRSWNLCHLGGFLSVMESPQGRWNIDIWLLKDYKKGVWIKEYIIDLTLLNYDVLTYMIPLAIERDGRILMQVNIGRVCRLHYYDPKGKNHEEIEAPERRFRAQLYVESFLSLGSR